jgi:DNA-binding NarL/FixJ family response regulator
VFSLVGARSTSRARLLGTAVEDAWAACTRLQGTHELAARAGRPAAFGRLTRREREIAWLLARGHTNRQIADTLVISEQTAETHVKRILGNSTCARATRLPN